MAFGSGKKPANQGSAGTPKVQPAKVSPPSKKTKAQNSTPYTEQNYRGHKTPGKGGTGTTAGKPQPFKG